MHYVCSDIHGQYGLYKELLARLDMKEDDTLYVIGDAIDRGPDSIGILKDMMERPNVELFLGNHELMMLDYYAGTGRPGIWLHESNGGIATLLQMWELSDDEREEILAYVSDAFLQKYVTVQGQPYALHHSFWLRDLAGTDVRYSDIGRGRWDDIFYAVWYSPYRSHEYVHPDEYIDSYIHIIGHVPVQYVSRNRNRVRNGEADIRDIRPPFVDAAGHILNIDGGCALLEGGDIGGLYCMSLETDDNGKRKELWIRQEGEWDVHQ